MKARFCICLVVLVAVVVTTVYANTLDVERVRYAPSAQQQAFVARHASQAATRFVAKVFSSRAGDLPYRLLSPALGTAHAPLVIVLHGSNQIGTDNIAQMGPFAKAWAQPEIAARFAAYVAVPQVPRRSAKYAPDVDGQPFSQPGPSFKSVLALVDDLAKTLPIDRRRIYVVGSSMGASTALQALLAEPHCFAAAAAFSPVPPARRLASRVADKPVLLVHGSLDTENPFEADRLWAQALTAAGGKPRFVVVEGMGHRVSPAMLVGGDWRTWLFAQRLHRSSIAAIRPSASHTNDCLPAS